MKAPRWRRVTVLLINLGARWGWVVYAKSLPLYPPPGKETRYSLYCKLARPQGRSGLVRKISPPPGFDTRTVHLAASRNSDCVLPANQVWVLFRQYWVPMWWNTSLFQGLRLCCSNRVTWSTRLLSCLYSTWHAKRNGNIWPRRQWRKGCVFWLAVFTME